MDTPAWSPQQDDALLRVKHWLDGRGDQNVFRLFGFAGSGKTTLAKHFAQGVDGPVVFGAYTGKAAYVLQQKGCQDATTIHSLIYKPAEKNKDRLMDLKQELEDIEAALKQRGVPVEAYKMDPQWKRVHDDLEQEKAIHKRPAFALNPESRIKDAALVVIDEVSMVDQRIGEDLLSFEVPILVLGDPAQLPPVRGEGYFTNSKPDVLLTEIHRQAAGNPVLRLATDVRLGKPLRKGDYGTSRIIGWGDVKKEDVMVSDQVLVGTNKRRHSINYRVRELLHREGGLPVRDDKLVCLRNNHELGLLNGGLWRVQDAISLDADAIDLVLKSDDGGGIDCVTTAHSAYFMGGEPAYWDIKERDCFDYGYALTCHKSQGSQWDKVYIFDESRVFRQDAQRWLYTAITRAAKQVVVVTD